MDADSLEKRGGSVALKELERLTGELENLALLLKAETNPKSRRVILVRAQEIMSLIAVGS